jgi:hypothetical protein
VSDDWASPDFEFVPKGLTGGGPKFWAPDEETGLGRARLVGWLSSWDLSGGEKKYLGRKSELGRPKFSLYQVK